MRLRFGEWLVGLKYRLLKYLIKHMTDTDLLNWLDSQCVDSIHLSDGTTLHSSGKPVRDVIRFGMSVESLGKYVVEPES